MVPFNGPQGTIKLKGRTAVLVGYGRTATLRPDGLGWTQVNGSNGVKRSATNTIDDERAIDTNIGTTQAPKIKHSEALVYDLDKPGDPSKSTLGTTITDREGGIATLDSGGAWFVLINNQVELVGISESVGLPAGSTLPDPYRFGGQGFGVYVFNYKSWIFNVTGLPAFGPGGGAPEPPSRSPTAFIGLLGLSYFPVLNSPGFA
jgi:hypothetical protein